MDKSIKRFLVYLLMGSIGVIGFFNALPYVFTSFDLDDIQTPDMIRISGIELHDTEAIEEIYDTIRSGLLREDEVKANILFQGKILGIEAVYEGAGIAPGNEILTGKISKLIVTENDIVSFDYYKNDSKSSRDFRVAFIRVDGIYDLLNKHKIKEGPKT